MGFIADLFAIGGLALLGYGLYIYEPWVCYVVVGAILMSAGGKMSADMKRSELPPPDMPKP